MSDLSPVPFPNRKRCLLAKVDALRELLSAGGEELSPPFHFGDATQSALMPSILDRAFKGEL